MSSFDLDQVMNSMTRSSRSLNVAPSEQVPRSAEELYTNKEDLDTTAVGFDNEPLLPPLPPPPLPSPLPPPPRPNIPDPDTLRVASHKIEAKQLRYETIIQLQKSRGIDYQDILRRNITVALGMMKKDRAHCFEPKEKHNCSGSTDAYWRLQSIQRQRAMWGKASKGSSVATSEEEQRLIKSLEQVCKFSRFEEDQVFYHFHDQQWYRATGDAYLCVKSGMKHICNPEVCDRKITLPGGEGIECALTHKFFGQPMVHTEEHNRDGEGRDGGMSYTNTKNRNGYVTSSYGGGGGGGGSSGKSSSSRKRKSEQDKADDQLDLTQRNLDPASLLIRDTEYPYQPYVETHMRELFPRVKHPIAPRQTRLYLSQLCTTLLYDKQVRNVLVNKLNSSECAADEALKQYYQQCHRHGKRRNLFKAMKIVEEHIKPHYERLQTIGFLDRPIDKNVVLYFQEAVICVWQLLHYTPYAKRYQTGIPLKKNAAGIIYKLQTGFYVNVLYDKVTRRVASFSTSNKQPPHQLSITTKETHSNLKPVDPSTKPCLLDMTNNNTGDELVSLNQEGQEQSPDQELLLSSSSSPSQYGRMSVCFLPRHKYLECLPQENELNKYTVFKNIGIGSNQVVESEKLICDCYDSLMQVGMSIDKMLDFTLERYITIRDVLG